MWGNWTETINAETGQKCNATCGDAYKTKTRKIVQTAAFGGLPCKGESLITEKCQLKPCPGNYTFSAIPYRYFMFANYKDMMIVTSTPLYCS